MKKNTLIMNVDNLIRCKITDTIYYDNYNIDVLYNRETTCDSIVYALWSLDLINDSEKDLLLERVKNYRQFVEILMESDDN